MKNLLKSLFLLIIISISFLISVPKVSAQQVGVSFQMFYDNLSPYGRWLDNPIHGYVWIPNVGVGFRPYYTSGHWVYTDDGWAWFSDYPWGWAPFHYGRWFYEPIYGWMWVPGTEWGPAWVVWRHAVGCYGWAPLTPGITIEAAFGAENIIPMDHWVFVNERNILSHNLNKHYINDKEYDGIFKRSTVISTTHLNERTHVRYVNGPERVEIERIATKKVKSVIIRDYDKPGHSFNKGTLSLYRPNIEVRKEGPKAEPKRVYKLHEIKLLPPNIEKSNKHKAGKNQMPSNNINPNQRKEQRPSENRQKPEKPEIQQRRVK